HLRMLAKYEFVERAPSRGREKPWRLVARARSSSPDMDDPESVQATSALALAHLEFQIGLIRGWLEQAHREESDWALASVETSSHVLMTREETAALSKAIAELTDAYAGRWED